MKVPSKTLQGRSQDLASLPTPPTFSRYFRYNPMPTFICTAKEGQIIDVSDSFLKMFHCRRKEIVGKRSGDLSLWASPESREVGLLHKDGKKESLNGLITAVRLKDGEICKVMVCLNQFMQEGEDLKIISLYNIAGQEKIENKDRIEKENSRLLVLETNLHDSHKWFQMLFKHSIDCLYLRDLEGHFIDLNNAALRLMGYTREEFMSLKFETIAGEENLAKISEINKERELPGFEDRLFEYKLRCKDGSYVYVEGNGFPLFRDGKPYAFMGIGRDITERKKTEELLRKREEELEIKTIHLEESNSALKALLREREKDRNDLEEKIITNVRETIKPYVEKLQSTTLSAHQKAYVDIIGSSLDKIISPFVQTIKSQCLNFTQTEIRITGLIREGKNSKEIADMMNVSERAIEFHRNNIRAKLGIKNKKLALNTYLLNLQ